MCEPKTLMEAVRYFADGDLCNDYMRQIKWPDGKVTCPQCGATGDRIGDITSRSMMQCKDCRKQFSYRVGTIFEDSPLGLDKWFVAVWCVANCKNGISSHELGRAIGVTQKTAWFMLHRIRKAMETDTFRKFDGPAEADTCYVGGRAETMHAARREKVITGRGAVNKTAVHGVLQRTQGDQLSRVHCEVISRENAETLMQQVRRAVRYGVEVFTDSASAYGDLALTHIHAAIDHSQTYVRGRVHTNGIENFWSLFRRTIRGTYIAIAPYHLQRYVAEQEFRFNHRRGGDGGRFAELIFRIAGKRLTWRILTGKDDAGFMSLT